MTTPYPAAEQKPGALDFMGLTLHSVDIDDVHQFMGGVIEQRKKALVLNLNVHCVNLALDRPWLKDFIRKAQLVFCDGDGVRWGVRILGHQPPPKIAFTRWIWELCGFSAEKGYRVYFLGARPGVAAEAARRLKAKYPRLDVAGVRDGYFPKSGADNDRVVEEINRISPDLLLVCFGMPEQEKWLCENWERLNAHIFLTGGAVLDFASGTIPEPPVWMVKCQLEWLFRLCREPRRLFRRYVLGIPYFFCRIIVHRCACRKH